MEYHNAPRRRFPGDCSRAAGLKKRIEAAKIPPSKLDETINVAIWNIREFGRKKRSEPAIHYIAEILGQFDLIALVELRNDLTDLGRVLPILGPSWEVVYSDWIDAAGGNDERIAFSCTTPALDFFGSDTRIKELFPNDNLTRTKFSYQLSDHFPVWVHIKTDIDGERLNQIVQNGKK